MSTIDDYQAGLAGAVTTYLSSLDESPVPLVLMNQGNPKPSYPFVGYTFTTRMRAEPGHEIKTGEDVVIDTENWVRQTFTNHFSMVASFTVYSDDEIESNNIAEALYNFFDVFGRSNLKVRNMVIKNIGPIQNRDSLIVDDYERRVGFDVTIRAIREVTQDIETIETVEFTE